MRAALALPVAAVLVFLCIPSNARGGEGDTPQKVVTEADVIAASERHDALTAAYRNARCPTVALDLEFEAREAYSRWRDLSEAQKNGISFAAQLKKSNEVGFGPLYSMFRQAAERYERCLLIAPTETAAQYFLAEMNKANEEAHQAMQRFMKSKKGEAGEAPKDK